MWVAMVAPYMRVSGTVAEKSSPYLPLQSNTMEVALPPGRRVPFGWPYWRIASKEQGLFLHLSEVSAHSPSKIFLRLMVALDTRDKRRVLVTLGHTGRIIGSLNIWFASALQIFECTLDASLAELKQSGIYLQTDHDQEPLYVLATTERTGSHVFVSPVGRRNQPKEAFLESLTSLRSLHPFGWMEGCTMDGLYALQKAGRLTKRFDFQERLRLFLPDSTHLIYENPGTEPSDNVFNNVEAGLPFAVISRVLPLHSSVKLFIDFAKSRFTNGKLNSQSLTTEGCYTLAYPLVVVGQALGDSDLYELALLELEARIKFLTSVDAVFQRGQIDGSGRGFRNWGRGFTWFLLGIVRTAAVLKEDKSFRQTNQLNYLREVFETYARLALSHQRPVHSWGAYLDLPETAFDASTTAGLGAALGYGKKMGWLTDLPEHRIKSIRSRLEKNFTADGLLTGSCQINRGRRGSAKK